MLHFLLFFYMHNVVLFMPKNLPKFSPHDRSLDPWAPAGGQGGGTCPPPWNLKKMTSYAAVLKNTPNFSLAPSALALDTLYFSLKRRKKRKNFRLRLRRAEKMVIFWYGAPKTCQLFKVSVVLPPSGKISAGAHVHMSSQINCL